MIPRAPGVEAAARLLDRRLVQVEPHERDQAALAALRERERAVVRGAEGGMPVGLVEAEHERARDAVLGHQRLELVVVADHAVDVVAEVEVGVEDVRPGGQQLAQLGVVALDQLRVRCRAAPPVWILVRVTRMPDVLIFADTFRSPELRHEVPLGIPDPFLYVERDGVRHI